MERAAAPDVSKLRGNEKLMISYSKKKKKKLMITYDMDQLDTYGDRKDKVRGRLNRIPSLAKQISTAEDTYLRIG